VIPVALSARLLIRCTEAESELRVLGCKERSNRLGSAAPLQQQATRRRAYQPNAQSRGARTSTVRKRSMHLLPWTWMHRPLEALLRHILRRRYHDPCYERKK